MRQSCIEFGRDIQNPKTTVRVPHRPTDVSIKTFSLHHAWAGRPRPEPINRHCSSQYHHVAQRPPSHQRLSIGSAEEIHDGVQRSGGAQSFHPTSAHEQEPYVSNCFSGVAALTFSWARGAGYDTMPYFPSYPNPEVPNHITFRDGPTRRRLRHQMPWAGASWSLNCVMVLCGPSPNGRHQHKIIKVGPRVGGAPTTQKPQLPPKFTALDKLCSCRLVLGPGSWAAKPIRDVTL
jgi:hypothetical protein